MKKKEKEVPPAFWLNRQLTRLNCRWIMYYLIRFERHLRGKSWDASTDTRYFILEIIFIMEEGLKRSSEAGCVSYLWGKEGPTVGWRATTAGDVAVVRHRPLLAQRGTARCRFSYAILHSNTDTTFYHRWTHRPAAQFDRHYSLSPALCYYYRCT